MTVGSPKTARWLMMVALFAAAIQLGGCNDAHPLYGPDSTRNGAGRPVDPIYGTPLPVGPLRTPKMPLDVPPPRTSRFGSPLDLARVTWVRPKLVCEVRFLTWTADRLLRQAAYERLRADKPANEVRRHLPV